MKTWFREITQATQYQPGLLYLWCLVIKSLIPVILDFCSETQKIQLRQYQYVMSMGSGTLMSLTAGVGTATKCIEAEIWKSYIVYSSKWEFYSHHCWLRFNTQLHTWYSKCSLPAFIEPLSDRYKYKPFFFCQLSDALTSTLVIWRKIYLHLTMWVTWAGTHRATCMMIEWVWSVWRAEHLETPTRQNWMFNVLRQGDGINPSVFV